MIYKEMRDEVLKQYDELLPLVEEIKAGEDTTFDTNLKNMNKSAEEVRNDRFVLMVIGEAKAGKSTFINAYLGKDIMPMDEKQCTSSIIEVRYGPKYTMKATYADGRTETVEGDDDIKSFLTQNAAINDEYRDIPVGIINLQLIAPRKGKAVPKEEFAEFMKSIQSGNTFSLSPEDYASHVKEYMEAHRENWTDIVVKMEIEFPFKDDDLRGIVLVDSPGVGARGGVGTITEEYLDKADAVMFLKAIGGASMESTSFCEFMESVVARRERNRRAMFLILTRKGAISANKVKTNLKAAQELFSRYIDKDQIIAVDSLAEFFRQKEIMPRTEEEIEAFMEKYEESDDCEPFILMPWAKTHNRENYLMNLRHISNFDDVDIALNHFARNAHFFLLLQLTNEMVGIMDNIISGLKARKMRYEEKLQEPGTLAVKLEKQRAECAATQQKIHVTAMKVERSYIAEPDGIISKRADAAVKTFKGAVEAISPDAEDSVTQLEALTEQSLLQFESLQDEIRNEIIDECNRSLVESSKAENIPYAAVKPDVSHQTLEKIKGLSRDDAYVDGDRRCFRKTEPKFSQRRYYEKVKDAVLAKIDEYRPALVLRMQTFAGDIRNSYLDELAHNLRLQEEECKRIQEDQRTEEEIRRTVKEIEMNIARVEKLRERIKPLKGGLTDYVGSKH